MMSMSHEMTMREIMVLLFVFVLSRKVDSAPSFSSWLHRPGTVYVCQGNAATLAWVPKQDIGTFYAVYFHKTKPNWGYLVGKLQDTLEQPTNRARLMPTNDYGITLADTVLSDTGTYEIQVYLNNLQKNIGDQAELRVLQTTVCPHPERYANPLYYSEHDASKHSTKPQKGNTIEVNQTGDYWLNVEVPKADPPVSCTIRPSQGDDPCQGRTDKMTTCRRKFSLHEVEQLDIIVNMTFIALEPSITKLTIRYTGLWASTPVSTAFTSESQVNNSKGPAKEGNTGAVVAGILVPLLLVILLYVAAVVYFTYRRRENPTKDNHSQCLKLESVVMCDICRNNKPGWIEQLRLALTRGPCREDEGVVQNNEPNMTKQGENKPLLPASDSIHHHCNTGDIEHVKRLCEADAVLVNSTDEQDRTPLGLAVALGKADLVEYLVDKGADKSLLSAGLAPLHLAAKEGHLSVVQLLLEEGCDIDQPSQNGELAWQTACDNNRMDIFDLLVEKKAKANIILSFDDRQSSNLRDREAMSAAGIAKFRQELLDDYTPVNDGTLESLLTFCLFNESPPTSLNHTVASEENHVALKAIAEAIAIRHDDCKSSLGTSWKCYGRDVHSIHTNLEVIVKTFMKAIFPHNTTVLETGSFYLNNAIGVLDKLEYNAVLDLEADKMKRLGARTTDKADKTLLQYKVTIPKSALRGKVCSVPEHIAEALGVLIDKHMEEKGLKKNKQIRVWTLPHRNNSAVCVYIVWVCPLGHPHELELDIIPSIQKIGRTLKSKERAPSIFDKVPFKSMKKTVDTLPLMLVSDKVPVEENNEKVITYWTMSDANTMPKLFECCDSISSNIRSCFQLLQLVREFLPNRMIYYKDRAFWERRNVVSSDVLFEIFKNEVSVNASATDWSDHILPTRLANMVDALLSRSRINVDCLEPMQEKIVLQETFGVIEAIRDTINRNREGTTTGNNTDELKCSAPSWKSLNRASNLSRCDVICVLLFGTSSDVKYSVQASWRQKWDKEILQRYLTNGNADEFYCYRIPVPKLQCEKWMLYRELYEVILDKFQQKAFVSMK